MMDAIDPILPNPSILPKVQPAARTAPVHRDGRGGGSSQHEQRRRRGEEEAVEVDIEGVDDSAGPQVAGLLDAGPVHLIDVTTDGDPGAPVRRIDLSA
jgi:hypothetical protein